MVRCSTKYKNAELAVDKPRGSELNCSAASTLWVAVDAAKGLEASPPRRQSAALQARPAEAQDMSVGRTN